MSSDAKLKTIDLINRSVKEGRQKAMVGSYEAAQEDIFRAIGLLRDLQSSSGQREKYAKAIRELEQEYNGISDNIRVCCGFSGQPPPPAFDPRIYQKKHNQKPKEPSYNEHVPVSIYTKGQTLHQNEGEPPAPPRKLFERFGGKVPFSHHSTDPANFQPDGPVGPTFGSRPNKHYDSPVHRQASGPMMHQYSAGNDVVYYVQKYP